MSNEEATKNADFVNELYFCKQCRNKIPARYLFSSPPLEGARFFFYPRPLTGPTEGPLFLFLKEEWLLNMMNSQFPTLIG